MFVRVEVAVEVRVAVLVDVGGTGVLVTVGVLVRVLVAVGGRGVFVIVGVLVAVRVKVWVDVGVAVGGTGVGVAVGGPYSVTWTSIPLSERNPEFGKLRLMTVSRSSLQGLVVGITSSAVPKTLSGPASTFEGLQPGGLAEFR